MITKDEIIAFEKEIAEIYSNGSIKAPVHLRSGREDKLIDIFNCFNIGIGDYVFGYWDSHELALLKGVSREILRDSIIRGNSIALSFPEHNLFCSGIVGSLCGVATGVAWQLKQSESNARVFHFCGDMSAETGIFHEAVKYAFNFDLPVCFIVCDNDVSVMTDTKKTWGDEGLHMYQKHFMPTRRFKYKNGYPHSGLGRIIKF